MHKNVKTGPLCWNEWVGFIPPAEMQARINVAFCVCQKMHFFLIFYSICVLLGKSHRKALSSNKFYVPDYLTNQNLLCSFL